jgi:lipoate-protein ligase A
MSQRFFLHHSASPHFNMAFDEWMLTEAARIPGSILARLYTWSAGTITLGFNQRLETAYDHAQVGATPVIRRITGGRAVYHDISELTYAFAFNTKSPASEALSGSTHDSSRAMAESLSSFLGRLGIAADWVKASSADNARPAFFHKAACFASHARYELVSGRDKIVASARRDWDGAALQHGSIKLHGLVGHPALKMEFRTPGTAPESIALRELTELGNQFRAAVNGTLQVLLDTSLTSIRENAAIAQRQALVEQHPVDRRDLIAQSFAPESL